MAEFPDTKPYVEHDPLIGHRYVPRTRRALPKPGGGQYEIAVNAAGVRSDREYALAKPAGVHRLLVFGDSYAAGQYVSNDQRFSEIMERRVADLEVMNFALEGTGTDQQLLIYENVASGYEHDLVMLFPFLQNIRRNMAAARMALDAKTGRQVLRAKPRFELTAAGLVLRNTPVPADERLEGADPEGNGEKNTDENSGLAHRLKSGLSQSTWGSLVKKALYRVKPWEPFPEYRRADGPEWSLMAAILRRFQQHAAPRPFVIVPVFYDSYIRYRMARNYWQRFSSLESAGVHVIDLLPHFQRLGRESVRCFQTPHDCHFSSYGHLVLADALLEELGRRGLLPGVGGGSGV